MAAGQRVPGSRRRFAAGDEVVDVFAARPGRVMFVAHLDDEPQSPGVFLWRNGRRHTLLLDGETLPGGGTVGAFLAVGIGADVDAFAARDTAGSPNDAIYVARNGGLTRLVGTGDPSPLGGTITGIDTGTTLTFRGNAVVYAATLSGASAPAALLATTP